jgi:hypothetical protein
MEIFSRILPRSKENHEKMSGSECLNRDSNRAPHDLEPTCSSQFVIFAKHYYGAQIEEGEMDRTRTTEI